MPKVIRRTYRSSLIKRKKRRYLPTKRQVRVVDTIIMVLCIFIVAIAIGSFLSQSVIKHIQTITTPQDTTYTIVGDPTISVNLINKELSAYHSPAQGSGQALYNDGIKYHIDPVYALAFFMEESNLGTKGVATQTHSLGNIRAIAGAPEYDGYRSYPTWAEGFASWYQLISGTYVKEWDLTTVDQIIPIYAPSTDNNNEQQYITTIKYLVNQWRTEEQSSQM